jgi:threonine synthase
MNRLLCDQTGESYGLDALRWCSDSGGVLDIEFDGMFDPESLGERAPTMWRYREAIPIDAGENLVSYDEGFTPLCVLRLKEGNVLVKLDFLYPSGSYKDRGAAVLVSQAQALRVREVVQDSSGNAGAAVACYCAKAGIKCHVFVPEKTSPGKTSQISSYGAVLHKVPGSREDTAEAARMFAETYFYASHVWNPFFLQGTKTFAFEICEQLEWKAPDTVILPAGNGTLLLGAYIGFGDLLKAGIIAKMPKFVAVQATNCAPLYHAFQQEKSSPVSIEPCPTLAEGIAIASPLRGAQMLRCVRESEGDFLVVEEDEIQGALREVSLQGLYIEPTSAAVVAGVKNYLRTSAQPDELIVSVLTGSGLKYSGQRQG